MKEMLETRQETASPTNACLAWSVSSGQALVGDAGDVTETVQDAGKGKGSRNQRHTRNGSWAAGRPSAAWRGVSLGSSTQAVHLVGRRVGQYTWWEHKGWAVHLVGPKAGDVGDVSLRRSRQGRQWLGMWEM